MIIHHPYLIVGYALFVGCTMLTMIAYRGIPMNLGAILETAGYVYVTIFGITLFHERMSKRKVCALVLILTGIMVYTI